MPLQMDPSRSRNEDTETTTTPRVINTSEQTTDIVKATQFGLVERCQELLNEGYDVNQRDAENITLLHWAAINCRKTIAKFYIDNGAIVDSVGGELSSTPLHWATRQGHLTIVVLLMKHGADPTVRDGEGCSAMHLAAQFGYTSIVGYLLAKGISPDIQDRGGMTPLMWSACRVQSADPTRLLLTFGASTSLQDRLKSNTALHWAIVSRNPIAFALLTTQQTNLDIPNANGETGFSMLKNMKHFDWISKKTVEKVLKKSESNKKRQHFFNDYKSDDAFKSCVTAAVPFLVMYGLGLVFSASIALQYKVVLLFLIYLAFRGISHLICDDRFMAVFPINVYMATKFWMYIVWIVFIMPVVPTMNSIIFFSLSLLLWFNFIRAWRGDPGAIVMTEDERYKTIIELAEEDGFDPKHFCTTCLVRKPLRSKHCAVCDRCVARFDHHCPWLSNCVGYKNHKYFIGYLFSLVLMATLYVLGALKYWDLKLGNNWSLLQVIMYQPWVTFMTVQAVIHAGWVTILLSCQLYQILWLGITTNERLNWTRYSYFGTGGDGGKGSVGYSKGFLQNCVDFFEIECLHPTKIDWMRTWAPTGHDEDNLRYSDSTPFLTNNRDNYQYV